MRLFQPYLVSLNYKLGHGKGLHDKRSTVEVCLTKLVIRARKCPPCCANACWRTSHHHHHHHHHYSPSQVHC
ncbi:unnamed protein product [Parnassius mnemosyne]|uniref:Uncharacterized protein n=1 Tax=Parnassius mnemosyne TaxID=213953 RepID=A0AAV1L407_9NEOP